MPALAARVRDGGVASESHHALVPQVGLADADDVARARAAAAPSIRSPFTNVPFVEPSSSTQTPSPRGSKRACCGRGVPVAAQLEVVVAAAADGDGACAFEREARSPGASVVLWTTTRSAAAGAGAARSGGRLAGREHHRLSFARPPLTSSLAARGAHDAPDEEVEQDEERDLEDQQQLVDRRSSPRAITRSPLPAEDHLRRAERDAVAVLELRPLQRAAVHLDPVRRVEVDDPVRRALLAQLGVAAGDVRVGELDVALARAADEHAPLLDLRGAGRPR